MTTKLCMHKSNLIILHTVKNGTVVHGKSRMICFSTPKFGLPHPEAGSQPMLALKPQHFWSCQEFLPSTTSRKPLPWSFWYRRGFKNPRGFLPALRRTSFSTEIMPIIQKCIWIGNFIVRRQECRYHAHFIYISMEIMLNFDLCTPCCGASYTNIMNIS